MEERRMGTMKAILKERPEPGAALGRRDIPRPGAGELLVRVRATSVCGTDLHIYHWNDWAKSRVRPPQIMGHELAGEVVEVGEGVASFAVGDYVSVETHIYCGRCAPCRLGMFEICANLSLFGVDRDGCFAEFAAVPAIVCWKNDPSIPPEFATLQEPLGNAVDTVLAEPIAARSTLVTGCGPVGLLAVAVARASGASPVIATDVIDYRLDLARRLGADIVLNARRDDIVKEVRGATGGDGVEVLLEMSGNPKALQQGLQSLALGGRVSILGVFEHEVPLDLTRLVVFKKARIYGIYGRRIFETWQRSAALLRERRLDLSPLVTHRMRLDEFKTAMDLMDRGECGKVVMHPAE
jgi:threonine 3-dehydrogenase